MLDEDTMSSAIRARAWRGRGVGGVRGGGGAWAAAADRDLTVTSGGKWRGTASSLVSTETNLKLKESYTVASM